jgi:hypothetical protein
VSASVSVAAGVIGNAPVNVSLPVDTTLFSISQKRDSGVHGRSTTSTIPFPFTPAATLTGALTSTPTPTISRPMTLVLLRRLLGRRSFSVHRLSDPVSTRLQLRQRCAQRDGVTTAADQLAQIPDVHAHLLDNLSID